MTIYNLGVLLHHPIVSLHLSSWSHAILQVLLLLFKRKEAITHLENSSNSEVLKNLNTSRKGKHAAKLHVGLCRAVLTFCIWQCCWRKLSSVFTGTWTSSNRLG